MRDRTMIETLRLCGLLLLALVVTTATVRAGNPVLLTNSLGMRFVAVPKLTNVLFSIWPTRVQDFRQFVTDHAHNGGYDYHHGKTAYVFEGNYDYQRGRTARILTTNDWIIGSATNGWDHPGFEQQDNCPVVCVNWEDAQWFCRWLTRKERAQGLLAANRRYRLPTDAEWSVSVGLEGERGDTPADRNMHIKDLYAWGNQWPPPKGAGNFAGEEVLGQAWHPQVRPIYGYRDGFCRTSPVDSFPPGRYGLYDMAGNVGQWCEDPYRNVAHVRVWRGGTWYATHPGHLWLSTRGFDVLDTRTGIVGFRVVISDL